MIGILFKYMHFMTIKELTERNNGLKMCEFDEKRMELTKKSAELCELFMGNSICMTFF